MISQNLVEQRRKITQWLAWGADYLAERGVPNSGADAEALILSVLGCRRHEMVLDRHPLTDEALASFRSCIFRRGRREPLQYILGEAHFFGRVFTVNRNVLIPRPETEQLVAQILERRRGLRCVVDVGTGSGCIAVTLAYEIPAARVVAVDISPAALDLARHNAARHGVSNKIEWVCGDLLRPIDSNMVADLVVANLPYIDDQEITALQPEVVDFEPLSALRGGSDGLAIISDLIPQALEILDTGGLLALEIGHDQGSRVKRLLERTGILEGIEVVADYGGLSRMVFAMKTVHRDAP